MGTKVFVLEIKHNGAVYAYSKTLTELQKMIEEKHGRKPARRKNDILIAMRMYAHSVELFSSQKKLAQYCFNYEWGLVGSVGVRKIAWQLSGGGVNV